MMLSDVSFTRVDVVMLLGFLIVTVVSLRRLFGKPGGTQLPGPKRADLIWGYLRPLLQDSGSDLIESWQKEYGGFISVPIAFGLAATIVLDPRAIHHIFTTNAYNFERPESGRDMLRMTLGGGVLVSEGDEHKRLRKTMTPGFTPAGIRFYTSIFQEMAEKVKDHWIELMNTANGTGDMSLNVEPWQDSMGKAGFSRDFGRVDGKKTAVGELFDAFGGSGRQSSGGRARMLLFLLLNSVPLVRRLPFQRNVISKRIHDGMTIIAKQIRDDRSTAAEADSDGRRSLVASILKQENHNLTEDEVIAQMNTLMFAAYHTTAASLAWCLHELSLHLEVQHKLREELVRFPEPTAQQLESLMPYLDAVVNETLRLHPIVIASRRTVMKDDSIPLLHPLTTADGKQVDHVQLAAGRVLTIPIHAINRSSVLWGPDSHEFKPERWLQGELPESAQAIQGYHHMITFLDGPRNCIGKNFAVAEMKAVVSVLVRDFVFHPWKDGTDVQPQARMFVRPRSEGTEGLMLRVSKVEHE